MRRAHGHYYSPLQPDVSNGIEQENEAETEALKQKIGALKSLTIDIGNEVRHQNHLLHDFDDSFDRTSGFLGHTMNRVLRLSRGGHNYYICYLLLFAVCVFFILYAVIKLK